MSLPDVADVADVTNVADVAQASPKLRPSFAQASPKLRCSQFNSIEGYLVPANSIIGYLAQLSST